MTVLIDADACPVVDITIRLCKKYHIPCILFFDTSHSINKDGVQCVQCDNGSDSVDFVITNRAKKDDIVITQDYGLASMCLGRHARVLHQDGWEYTEANIDALLFSRHEARKARTAGNRTKGPKKRTASQDTAFEQALERVLQKTLHG